MATAASAANSPTTAAARSDRCARPRSHETSSTPTGVPSWSTGCHSAETAPVASTTRRERPCSPVRSATKKGSPVTNTLAVAELVASSGTRIGAASAPGHRRRAPGGPSPSGSMSTAIIPSHTARAPSQIAWRATGGVRRSRQAPGDLRDGRQVGGVLEREHAHLLLGKPPVGDVVDGDHAGRPAVVRDRPAATPPCGALAALRDADDLVPLLALALDALDQEIVVLGRDDVEHGELERLVGGVAEGGLEGLVDLDDPAVTWTNTASKSASASRPRRASSWVGGAGRGWRRPARRRRPSRRLGATWHESASKAASLRLSA